MKTMKFLTYATFVLFLGFAISSCSGDDGIDGAMGSAGVAGTDGADGTDGTDGTNGDNGADGADGNANVQTYVYNDPIWNNNGFGMEIDMANVLSDDILENDALMVYVKHSGVDMVANIPGNVWTPGWRNYGVNIGNSVSTDPGIFILQITSFEMGGTPTLNGNLASIDWVKVIIIESTSTTTTDGNGGKAANTKQTVYSELEAAGVDVNDYYAVCAYYGINPE